MGCEELADKLRRGDIRPVLHCFGHIHGAYTLAIHPSLLFSAGIPDSLPSAEARGTHLQQWEGSSGETLLVNSSIVEFDMERFHKEKSCKW